MTRLTPWLLALILVPGCASGGGIGDGGGGGTDAGQIDGGSNDAGAGDGGPMCAMDELSCRGTCVDPMSDAEHCGDCDSPCGTGQSCDTGACVCTDAALTLCGTDCADFETDPAHCGGCARPCSMGEECSMGRCLAACADTETRCGTDCADTMTDPAHCGGCAGAGGTTCAMSEECLGGGCVAACAPTETRCGADCADTNSDPRHCGGCAGMGGTVCATGEICAAGACRRGSVLVYYDSFTAGSVPAELAARRMGIPVTATSNPTAFDTAYDTGIFSIVVVSIPGSAIPAGVRTRVMARISMALPLIFSWWDLDSDAALATALGVSTATFSAPQPLYPRTGASVNLFTLVETIRAPMTNTNDALDNGDVLTLLAGGEILLALGSGTGRAAGALTSSGRVLVNGFVPWDYEATDNDADGVPDMVELYVNEYTLMLR